MSVCLNDTMADVGGVISEPILSRRTQSLENTLVNHLSRNRVSHLTDNHVHIINSHMDNFWSRDRFVRCSNCALNPFFLRGRGTGVGMLPVLVWHVVRSQVSVVNE